MTQALFLSGYVPVEARQYCYELWQKWKFDFKIVRPRKTRLGDFRIIPGRNVAITINSDLNNYSFLITYLHEVAHCIVFQKYGARVAPHGTEWKAAFRELLQPVMNSSVFPENILNPLIRYSINPKASTGSDAALFLVLKEFDEKCTVLDDRHTSLFKLNEGATFRFKNRIFLRAELRRTRILCIDKKTRRKYTLPSHALVEIC
jgi:SprT protein